MNNALKGALLSGLVWPGLGQVVLKHYKRGIVLMLTVLAGLSVMVVIAVQQARTVIEKMASEGGIIDRSAISNAVAQATASFDGLVLNLLLFVIVMCWIFGIVDAYRIGKNI
jgi:hypothetical protein